LEGDFFNKNFPNKRLEQITLSINICVQTVAGRLAGEHLLPDETYGTGFSFYTCYKFFSKGIVNAKTFAEG
jgi:hypothetical protein